MKIELESPFDKLYKAGYLNMNKEPRRLVLLVDFDNKKTTISYARYLMTVKLNRILEPYEHVDHIDNDKLNDVIDNLQIISVQENNIKRVKHLKLETQPVTLVCPVCEITFSKPRRQVIVKLNANKKPTCSRKCGGIYSHYNK